MQDLLVQAHINLHGKNVDFCNACLSGLISGLTVQLELLKKGVKYYDGSLVHILKVNSDRPIGSILRDLGDLESHLSIGMFMGWECAKSKDYATTYFSNMGSGGIYVSKLMNELVSFGSLADNEAVVVTEKIVTNLIKELKKLF